MLKRRDALVAAALEPFNKKSEPYGGLFVTSAGSARQLDGAYETYEKYDVERIERVGSRLRSHFFLPNLCYISHVLVVFRRHTQKAVALIFERLLVAFFDGPDYFGRQVLNRSVLVVSSYPRCAKQF